MFLNVMHIGTLVAPIAGPVRLEVGCTVIIVQPVVNDVREPGDNRLGVEMDESSVQLSDEP
jgi:hypothetical protein